MSKPVFLITCLVIEASLLNKITSPLTCYAPYLYYVGSKHFLGRPGCIDTQH